MTASELRDWEIYFSLEPFGGAQEDWRSAIIACMIHAANRGKSAKALKPEDLFPSLKAADTKEEPAEWRRMFQHLAQRQRPVK